MREAVEGISDLITIPGIINIDFADIRSVMENAGAALMGIGSASGENRAVEAAKAAISSPLLEISINGAKGVLFSIAGGDDVTMFEIQDAAKIITESVDPNAKIIFGTVHDEKLKKGELKITVIASNFSDNYSSSRKAASLFPTFSANVTPASPPPHKEVQKPVAEEKKLENKQTPPSPIEDNDDDWSAVPAFLRRSKLK